MGVRERLGFAVAVAGQNLVYTFLGLYLLVYLYDTVGLSERAVVVLTATIAAIRVWDAVDDLLVGLVVDRTRTRWGTYRPYVLLTALPVALLTWALFSVPDVGEGAQVALVAVVYLLWGITYTACDVPLWSLTAVVATDDESRSRLVAWARAAAMLGLAVATLVGAPLALALSAGPEVTAQGWSRAALLVALVGMGLYSLAFFATTERVAQDRAPVPLRTSARRYLRNRPLLLVLLSGVLGFGQLVVQVGGAVVASVVFGGVEVFTTLGGALVAGVVVGAALAPRVLRRSTRRRTALIALAAMSAAGLVLLAVGPGSVPLVAALFALVGACNGVHAVTQTLLVADTSDLAEVRTGERVDGASFAGLTFVSKLGGALATLVFGVAVSAVGYAKGVEVTPSMREELWRWLTIVPALSSAAAMLPLLRYDVPEADLPRLLRARRAGEGAAPRPHGGEGERTGGSAEYGPGL
ncbi:MFS transporter [Janibacter melonis]|uniref:MFS transporter n=1 Tax=Janibacter melonis TaxID=262209 RepID=UPI00191A3205|nr:glycoside-pentoside-hexuronide (GPH):cation symporter [Janibacter melonis]